MVGEGGAVRRLLDTWSPWCSISVLTQPEALWGSATRLAGCIRQGSPEKHSWEGEWTHRERDLLSGIGSSIMEAGKSESKVWATRLETGRADGADEIQRPSVGESRFTWSGQVLFQPILQLVRWGPPTFWRAIFLFEVPKHSVLIRKTNHCNRYWLKKNYTHIPKKVLYKNDHISFILNRQVHQ